MKLDDFIRSGAKLTISKEPYPEVVISGPPHCDNAIVIIGNEDGFRSLLDVICYYRNEIEERIPVSSLSFIESKLDLPFVIDLETDEDVARIRYGIIVLAENEIRWQLSQAEVGIVVASLHGLGYAWNHLHFDPPSSDYDCAVYCVLE